MKIDINELIEKFENIKKEITNLDDTESFFEGLSKIEYGKFLDEIITSLTVRKNEKINKIETIKRKIIKWMRIGYEVGIGILYLIFFLSLWL